MTLAAFSLGFYLVCGSGQKDGAGGTRWLSSLDVSLSPSSLWCPVQCSTLSLSSGTDSFLHSLWVTSAPGPSFHQTPGALSNEKGWGVHGTLRDPSTLRHGGELQYCQDNAEKGLQIWGVGLPLAMPLCFIIVFQLCKETYHTKSSLPYPGRSDEKKQTWEVSVGVRASCPQHH